MNHAKIVLVACISGFVAITTAFLGVTGTIIGSVLSSVLYNVLSEILEKPVTERKFSFNFEYEIAYVFPLVVIAIIQLLLLTAFLSQWGFLPGTFLNAYLQVQNVVDNNLYRVLGAALIVMGIYPFIIKPNIIKKSYGAIVGFIGVIFLARGFVDAHSFFTNLYGVIFHYFDFPIEVFAFFLLVYVIFLILNNASQSHKEFKQLKQKEMSKEHSSHHKVSYDDLSDLQMKEVTRQPKNSYDGLDSIPRKHSRHNVNYDGLDDLQMKEVPKKQYNRRKSNLDGVKAREIPVKKFEDVDEFKDDYIPYKREPRKPRNSNSYDMEKYQLKKKPARETKPYGDNHPDIDFNRDHLPSPKRNPLNKDNKRR